VIFVVRWGVRFEGAIVDVNVEMEADVDGDVEKR
jgi:hypothetical protein